MSEEQKVPAPNTPDPKSNDASGIGDHNVERLLTHAYKPELPEEAFAKRVEAQMWFAAQEASKTRAVAQLSSATAASPTPSRSRWPISIAVAAALIIAAFLIGTSQNKPGFQREKDIVWIDGQPYFPQHARNGSNQTNGEQADHTPWTPVPPLATPTETILQTSGYETMTPRAQEHHDLPVEKVKVGETLATASGQRRRVTLPDGSVLYINESTQLTIEADRRIVLAKGEVYVEVSPRDPKMKDGDPTFVVQAKERSFTAYGTKFVVRTDDGEAKLVVTQGKVKVSGFDDYVLAGQQLKLGKAPMAVEPSIRTSLELDWTRDLMAMAASPLVPASSHTGGALIAVDPYGQEVHLSLRAYHVDVFIQNGFARTTIDQTYFNSSHWRMEGTFYFPLPPDASLSRLAMYVGEDLMEGGMAERDHARNVFEQIVRRQKDPALLEWVDGSTFKMRVFPLEARQEKRIILSYTQRLSSVGGETTYRFPAGHSLALVRDWSIKMFVQGGAHLLWNASHKLTEDKKGDDLELAGEEHQARLDRDVVLHLCEPGSSAEDGGLAHFNLSEYEGAKYLMVRYRPDLAGLPKHPRRDWVFIFEADGSRDPVLARVQVNVIRTLLEHAEHDDTFAILTAGTRVQAYAKEAQPATPENIKAAVAFLESTHLVGALDLGQALSAARPFLEVAKNPHLVHVGAGVPILGERTEAELLKRIPSGTHYVGVGVGKRWGRAFMKNAAARDGGYFTQINPDEQIGWRAFDLLATLNAPRLLDLKVIDEAERATFLGYNDCLAQGEEICAVARLEPGKELPKKLTITGKLDGKTWQKSMAVSSPDGNAGYLPRAWSKLEIDRLLAENAEANKDRIIALSKAMYVMSPYTSLLVLENKEMYEQFKVDTGRKDHWAMYPCPTRIPIVYEPVPGHIDPRSVPSGQSVVETKKPAAEQILSSILVRMPVNLIYWPNQRNYSGQVLTALQLSNGSYGYGYYYYRDWERHQRADAINTWSTNLGIPVDEETTMGRVESSRFADIYASNEIRAVEKSIGMTSSRLSEGKQLAFKAKFEQMQLRDSDSRERAFNSRGKGARRNTNGMLDELVGYEGYLPDYFNGYQRPYFSGDFRVFSDLLSYAPGMNTILPDIQSVVESEAAADPNSAPGHVAPEARALIEKARKAGWQSLQIPAEGAAPAYEVIFDGEGRYAYRRILESGLLEQAWCDGQQLWLAYPELGVCAVRSFSRFHRQGLTSLLPTFVPPADDLARGADLVLLDEHTVAVVPVKASSRKVKDGQAVPYKRVHLIFGEQGNLLERRWVEMPSGKTIESERVENDALVCRNELGVTTHARKIPLTKAAPPQLKPVLDGLVVLPFPIRTWDAVVKQFNIANQQEYEKWDEATAMAAICSKCGQYVWEAQQIIGRRYFSRGDRRLGFYTLLMSCQGSWDPKTPIDMANMKVTFDPEADHPGDPLAVYLANQIEYNRGNRMQVFKPCKGGALLTALEDFRTIYTNWSQGNVGRMPPAERADETRKSLAFVKKTTSDEFAWAILGMIQNYGADATQYREIADAHERFANNSQFGYTARYERARWLLNANDRADAQKVFTSLINESLDAGNAPMLDYAARQAFQNSVEEQKAWTDLVRGSFDRLLKKGTLSEEIKFAWQLMQMGEQPTAEEIVNRTLAAASQSETECLPATLIAAAYFRQSGQYARAETLVANLLSGKYGQDPALWRLTSDLANQRGHYARSLAFLETAMDLEYRAMPNVVDVQALRQDFSMLMQRYQMLAEAITSLQTETPKEFVAKVVRVADRWRAIDTDPTMACQMAAHTLQTLGAKNLAWDYLTTPLAEKPNEAAPWVQLAMQLRNLGGFELADRAYAEAFVLEPTNPQILWDRAQNLLQSGKTIEATPYFKQIADGTWQTSFDGLKSQAQHYLDWQK